MRPWQVRLTNLQELLDQLDILKKYAGIRIEDFYNWMLRSGYTLGSIQLMKVLQAVIWAYHGPTIRMLEAHWKETEPDMVVSFVPHFNRALGESFRRAYPNAAIRNRAHGRCRLSAAFLDRAPVAIFHLWF